MTLVIVGVFILYGLMVLLLYIGWERAYSRPSVINDRTNHFISVIIPVRNEEKNISLLLTDLSVQHLHIDQFEIIVVDDHSEDGTASIVHKINFLSNCRVISSEGIGKKSALSTGIKHAKGNIIVTTDGDCRVGVQWLQSIYDSFSDEAVKLVFGPVRIDADQSLFSKMQAMEFASLIGSGAATMSFGIPTMCNGANFAFRKDVFDEVKGYDGNEHIASGDDEFLMRKIYTLYPAGVRFNNFTESIVSTNPQTSVTQFFSQRVRWAGKWRHHHDLVTKLLGLVVILFHTSVLLLPVVFYFDRWSGDILLALLISKVILEYLFLQRVTSWLGVRWNWISFILLQFFYPLYAIIVGLYSLWKTPYWKGRK